MNKKIISIMALTAAASMLISGCFFNKNGAETTSNQTEPAPTATSTPEPTEEPKSAKELIVGSWKFTNIEDKNGKTVAVEDANFGDGAGLLVKALSSGADATFTEDGKLKMSVFSVNYSFDSDDTITLSGGVMPQAYSGVAIGVDENTLKITVGDYKIVMERV